MIDQAYDVRGLDENPYLGLRAYTYEERDRYAGREEDVRRALAALTRPGDERTLLFVTGASGSGKSSFAQAGLLPALEKHYQQQAFTVKWAIFRPGEKPLAGLATELRTLGLAAEGVFAPAAPYQSTPPPQPAGPDQISILIVDQFEELFTQAEAGQRDALFAILAALPPFRAGRLHVIATMRADYLPDLFEHRALYDIAKAGADLRAMSEDQLKAAIQRPLQAMHPQAGKRFQDALLKELAHDAAADAGRLPLLQVTLEDLWRTGILTADHYDDLTDAIRKRADEVYTSKEDAQGRVQPRPPQEQARILKIFLALVDVSADDQVQRDVRRTRRLDRRDRRPRGGAPGRGAGHGAAARHRHAGVGRGRPAGGNGGHHPRVAAEELAPPEPGHPGGAGAVAAAQPLRAAPGHLAGGGQARGPAAAGRGPGGSGEPAAPGRCRRPIAGGDGLHHPERPGAGSHPPAQPADHRDRGGRAGGAAHCGPGGRLAGGDRQERHRN